MTAAAAPKVGCPSASGVAVGDGQADIARTFAGQALDVPAARLDPGISAVASLSSIVGTGRPVDDGLEGRLRRRQHLRPVTRFRARHRHGQHAQMHAHRL